MFKLKELNKENNLSNKYRSNTSPLTDAIIGNNYYIETPEKVDRFKNSSILQNATENIFLKNNNSQSANLNRNLNMKIKQNKNEKIFANTYNFAESVISLHESINNNEKVTSSTFYNNNLNMTKSNSDSYLKDNFKSVSMYPALVTPLMKKMIHSDNFPNEKQAINLEDLFIQEQKLWSILESLRYNISHVSFSCEDYFEFLNITSLQSIDTYFQTYETKIHIGKFINLEIFSILCVIFSIIKNKLYENNSTVIHLKNLIFNVHQNFLILINLVIMRLPKEYESNIWAEKLKKNIEKKEIKFLSNDDFFLLKQNNTLIMNSAFKFISGNLKNKNDFEVYEVLFEVLQNCDKYSYSTVKNIMFNLVNYYF